MISFSVILPNYNHGKFLKERIESILNQTWEKFEIIILDDASTDYSREIIKEYRFHEKVKSIIYNDTNSSKQTLQWIKGIESSSMEWIWIAESDDIAEITFLETVANLIIRHPGPKVFFTDSYYMKEVQKNVAERKCADIKNEYFQTKHWDSDYISSGILEIDAYMKYVCTINNVSCCIIPKKEALDVLYSFPHMTFYNDWLFYIRMLERFPVVYSAQCENWYRIHEKSHFNTPGKTLVKRKECFNILSYLYKAPYITGKNKLVKFFTEQYLGIGLWKERKYILPLFSFCLRISSSLFFKFITHLLIIKITRKKIKYIF